MEKMLERLLNELEKRNSEICFWKIIYKIAAQSGELRLLKQIYPQKHESCGGCKGSDFEKRREKGHLKCLYKSCYCPCPK